MRGIHLLACVIAVSATCSLSAQTILDPVQGLLLGSPSAVDGSYSSDLSGGYRVAFTKLNSFFVIHLPAGTSIAGKTHLDVRLKNNLSVPTKIEVNLSSNNGAGWMSSNVVVGAMETIDLTMPLRTASEYGIRVLPSPLDTSAAQTRTDGNIFPADVRGVYFFNKSNQPMDVSVQHVAAVQHTVQLEGFVDTFGQQRLINWPGKIDAAQQMRDMIPLEPTGTFPYTSDSYGGLAGSKNYGASTRFRTIKDGTNWFLVTPQGNRFFSVGVNEVGAQAYTPTTGREALFTDLAALKTNFGSHFKVIDGLEQFTPYSINLERKFGAAWKTDIVPLFLSRMKTWGFNTVGVSSWDVFMQKQMPGTFGLNITSPHAKFHAYDGRWMPDVWDATWVTALRADIALRLTESKANQSYSIGMFVDNEMPWSKGKSSDINYRNGLAVAALNSPGTASHTQFIAQLKTKYKTIAKLNTNWGSAYPAWSALSAGGIRFSETATSAVKADLSKFTQNYAHRYFQQVKQAITAGGYQGMYLGCRFTGHDYNTDVINVAKQYANVLSFNIYEAFPAQTNPDIKSLDSPVMISEFCFGANDQGRVGMPLFPTTSEASRVDAYRRFFNGLKDWKNLVGVHWYRWEDFPSTGKVDHDNMQEGLITITDRFYDDLVEQTSESTADHMSYLSSLP